MLIVINCLCSIIFSKQLQQKSLKLTHLWNSNVQEFYSKTALVSIMDATACYNSENTFKNLLTWIFFQFKICMEQNELLGFNHFYRGKYICLVF